MKIRTAIVGVGNCFAGLYQGIEYYKKMDTERIGLMHENIGPYSWKDIEFVLAYDVSKNKVGKPLHEAVYAKPNYVKIVDSMPENGVIVQEAPVLDGVGKWVKDMFEPMENTAPIEVLREKIINEIKQNNIDVLINYLPVGSQKAVEFWADVALESGTAFVNCMPIFIASNPEWENKFREKNIPIIGDDIKSQVGATIIHRVLAKLFEDRGAILDRSYQLNFGGNTDFLNMLERERLKSKKISKTESVKSQLKKHPIKDENIHIGPSDYVPFMKNNKVAYIRLEGRMWADVPFNIELRLDVDDKPNSAGVAVDAIRLAKLAKDRNIGGALLGPSAYLMKHPPVQYPDPEAKQMTEEFIKGEHQTHQNQTEETSETV